MSEPEGKLTPAQFEIMQLVWDSRQGMTIGEIWEAIQVSRKVSRTTVLNLVDRLEKRGWLKRDKAEGVFRYSAVGQREQVTSQLAINFVHEFFAGSAANLLMSLLGSQQISASDLQRLKRLINDKSPGTKRQPGESS